MENIFFGAAAKYVLASGDTRPLNFLARMKNWFKRECIVPPPGISPRRCILPYVFEDWWPTRVAGPGFHHLWSMADCLSTSAYLFDDADDRMWATILFETAVRYWQDKPGKSRSALSAAGWSPITMRPLMFPNSESKVLGTSSATAPRTSGSRARRRLVLIRRRAALQVWSVDSLCADRRPPGLLRRITGLRAFRDAGQEACGPRVHDSPDRS